MLVLHEAGRTDDHIEYSHRADAESDAIRWMNGENPPFTTETVDDNNSSSGSSPPSLTPKPTRPKPPSM